MCRRPVVFLEDLIFGLEAADQVNQPSFIGEVLLLHDDPALCAGDPQVLEELLNENYLGRRLCTFPIDHIFLAQTEDLVHVHLAEGVLVDKARVQRGTAHSVTSE